MYWTEEDIQPAVTVATELFGPAGNMMHGKNMKHNVMVATDKFGKIWYGDVDGSAEYIESLLNILSQRIGTPVYLVTE